MNEISLTSKPVVVTGPIDFSDFHREETARRLKEEQENNGCGSRRWTVEEKPPAPRKWTEEEMEFWKAIAEAEKDDDKEEEEEVEEEKPIDVEETKKICRDHLNKRLEILIEGKEDNLSNVEFDSLPLIDRMRLEFTKEYEWDASELDPIVRAFIEKQIEDCPFEETVVGYQTLLEMYNSYLGPEFYFLMMLKKAYNFREYESWLLFGY
ncbi:hypothetical protein L5515_018643 [Caenorhabditis briggsae]|uniref:Uncharacterized protein n=1 Tax=Caenorhabditis briggsae TaxID=6238 RepID=A0AAE9FC04_CAEBR|nr:hypothetical protein L5515_018643 [Caenorhabditis briggsae]